MTVFSLRHELCQPRTSNFHGYEMTLIKIINIADCRAFPREFKGLTLKICLPESLSNVLS